MERQKTAAVEPHLLEQFQSGRLLGLRRDNFYKIKSDFSARISSRPGQSGRCDGYILEGKELEFYLKKVSKLFEV